MPRGDAVATRPRNTDGTFAPGRARAIARRTSQPARRNDVFSSQVSGLGSFNSKTSCDTWQAEIGQGQYVQENAYRFRGIVRRIVGQEPRDAMRKSWGVRGFSQSDQMALTVFNERRDFDSKFQNMRELARKTGGSAMLMDIDDGNGDDLSKPVNFQNIRRIGQLTVMDRYELEIRDFEHNIKLGTMYHPKAYFLVTLNGVEVHPSRMLVMHGIPLTARERMANQGWGESVINAVWKALRDYMTTNSYIAEAVTRATQGVITMPALEGPMTGCDAEKIEERMQMLSFWMSAIGDIALTGDEKYEVVQRGFAGLEAIQKSFFDVVVVETEIPSSILGGQTPGGLNTGENAGEWQSWTSFLGGEQKRTYNPLLRQYLDIVLRAGNSPVLNEPDMWDIEWPDLYEPNAVEFSSSVAAIANAGVLLAQHSIYSDDEIRNNAILTQAFPHGEKTTVETKVRTSPDEPEDPEDLSPDADEDDE